MKYLILKEIFYSLSLALLMFIGLEILWPRLVLAYINLNFVLLVWSFIAIVIIAVNGSKKEL